MPTPPPTSAANCQRRRTRAGIRGSTQAHVAAIPGQRNDCSTVQQASSSVAGRRTRILLGSIPHPLKAGEKHSREESTIAQTPPLLDWHSDTIWDARVMAPAPSLAVNHSTMPPGRTPSLGETPVCRSLAAACSGLNEKSTGFARSSSTLARTTRRGIPRRFDMCIS
jgi:hypothetical protein